jgi:F-actin capping protein alpha subunit
MSEFLLQSPPGQINDVYNDLIALTSVDASLFKTHNLEQLIPYKVLGTESFIIPGLDGSWEGNLLKFKNSAYSLDHVKLEATVKKEGKEDVDAIRYLVDVFVVFDAKYPNFPERFDISE